MQLHLIMGPEIVKAIEQGKDVSVYKFNLNGIIITVILIIFIWKVVLPFISNLFSKLMASAIERQSNLHKVISDSNMHSLLRIMEHNKEMTIQTMKLNEDQIKEVKND